MTKSFNEIATLRSNAKAFEGFWDRYDATVANPSVDKYNASFGGDQRFINFKVSTFFESHTGVYGNSSCSNFGRFDQDLAQAYMVRAMNALRKELFAKCAELMKADAAKKVDAARLEVEAMNEALNACLADAQEGGAL